MTANKWVSRRRAEYHGAEVITVYKGGAVMTLEDAFMITPHDDRYIPYDSWLDTKRFYRIENINGGVLAKTWFGKYNWQPESSSDHYCYEQTQYGNYTNK